MQFETFFDDGRPGNGHGRATVGASFGEEAMRTEELSTRPLTKADYDYIVREIDQWWGGPTSALAHPIFFYELGEHAKVVEADGLVVGFLFGFIAPDGTGYVHLVGIHPDFRRKHVGSMLYKGFEESCRAAGCKAMKAITTLGNDGSVRFHEALGWAVAQTDDYAGPGRARIVFTKQLDKR
jgi:GNAT superfamily N-acetyltransferase